MLTRTQALFVEGLVGLGFEGLGFLEVHGLGVEEIGFSGSRA